MTPTARGGFRVAIALVAASGGGFRAQTSDVTAAIVCEERQLAAPAINATMSVAASV